jgi:hypothetical protein
MRYLLFRVSVAFVFSFCLIFSAHAATPSKPAVAEHYGQLSLSFEANQGQTDPQVRFLSRGPGYSLFLTPTEVILGLRKSSPDATANPMRMQLIGANATPQVAGVETLPGKVNYLRGKDPKQWRTNVTTYGKVKYSQVYPGVDLVYYGNQRQLEYDFIVAPGANPGTIRLNFAGTSAQDKLTPQLDKTGDLIVGEVRLHKPVLYQEIAGKRKTVEGNFRIASNQEVGFQVAAYDKTRPLVIDPVLVYSTYLGGSREEKANGIAVDSQGQVYIAGETASSDFPLANAMQSVRAGKDAFIMKLNASGDAIIYATVVGGSDEDRATSIAVDAMGQVYVTGVTISDNFPTVNALQPALGGATRKKILADAFVAKLNAAGDALFYATYLGGRKAEEAYGIAIDTVGQAYIAGSTSSPDFPIANALQPARAGSDDAFITKLNAAGTALIYSTYLGGSEEQYGIVFGIKEAAYSVAVDNTGQAYIAGETAATDFPTVNALQATMNGFSDGFITKLNSTGSAFVYSTYLGGTNSTGAAVLMSAIRYHESVNSIAVDASEAVYVAGTTRSTDFPTVHALQPIIHGYSDAFVAKLRPNGSALVYSTYLGGRRYPEGAGSNMGEEGAYSIAIDPAGQASVTGMTRSTDFPTVNAPQSIYGGGDSDAFISKLNASGSALIYSSYLGGSGNEAGSIDFFWETLPTSVAVDAQGQAYVAGITSSSDFPVNHALQPAYGSGDTDAFITKIGKKNPSYALTITKSGKGSGTVTSDPAGIVCGANCTGRYPLGTPVTLTATPDPGATFKGWSGACTGIGTCVVNLTTDQNVGTRFGKKP